jgi:large subunit ribosomal protein L31
MAYRALQELICFIAVFYQFKDGVAVRNLEYKMKTEIHPTYNELVATCSCGNIIKVGSTLANSIYLDVCSSCHPFYTGKQKTADAGGRIDRFNKRFGTAKKGA